MNYLDRCNVNFENMSARDALNEILRICGLGDVLEGIKEYSLSEDGIGDTVWIFENGTCDFLFKDGKLFIYRK